MNNPLIFLLHQFANKNNLELDRQEAKVQLLSHPYFPSINSITDLFNYFGINNYALRVEKNLNILSKIPESFLAQLGEGKASQLVLVSKMKDRVELIYSEEKSENINWENFLEIWSGILVVVDKPEKLNYNKNQKLINGKIKQLTYFSTLLILFGLFITAKPSFLQFFHFALSCTGIYVSYLILLHELGFHSKILEKVCSGEIKNSGCDTVLGSKGSKILDLFNLSDVGLVYFSSLMIGMIITASINVNSTAIMFLVSTLTIPFTIYSLYYQWKVVQSWCPLCIAIVGILWMQFGTMLLNNSFWNFSFLTGSGYIIFFLCLLTTTSLWIFIKPLLIKRQEFEKLEIDHIKFKRNFKLFKAALNLNPTLNSEFPIANEVVFGNKNADVFLKIIIITNPMCGYCKESQRLVEKILDKEIENVQIIIRFNVQAEFQEAIGTRIAAKILELYHTTNEKNCLNSLSDIFSIMDANSWLKKWGETNSKKYFNTLLHEKVWCSNNNINFTPDLLVNGQRYPKEYEKMDLLYFLDELIGEQAVLENA